MYSSPILLAYLTIFSKVLAPSLCPVAYWLSLCFCPSSVSIHDNSNMPWHVFFIKLHNFLMFFGSGWKNIGEVVFFYFVCSLKDFFCARAKKHHLFRFWIYKANCFKNSAFSPNSSSSLIASLVILSKMLFAPCNPY